MALPTPVGLPPSPGTPVDDLAEETTQVLARQVQDQILRIPRNIAHNKALQSLDLIDRATKLIIARGLETTKLTVQLKSISQEIEKFQEDSASTTWCRFLSRFGRSRKAEDMVKQLNRATEIFKMHTDIRPELMVQPLLEKAFPEVQKYSNAELANALSFYSDRQDFTKPWVDIFQGCTTVELEIKNQDHNRIRIQFFLDADFRAACNRLAGKLRSFSRSIEEIFPRGTASPGSIMVQTAEGAHSPIILWVYHNILVWAQLRFVGLDESVKSPETDATTASFMSSTDLLFQHIRDGCVATREEVTTPRVQRDLCPDIVRVGEQFVIQVSVDQQAFQSVDCDTQKLVNTRSEILESQRKYTFFATESGEAFVCLRFAHHLTFNPTSIDFKIHIEPRQNKPAIMPKE